MKSGPVYQHDLMDVVKLNLFLLEAIQNLGTTCEVLNRNLQDVLSRLETGTT